MNDRTRQIEDWGVGDLGQPLPNRQNITARLCCPSGDFAPVAHLSLQPSERVLYGMFAEFMDCRLQGGVLEDALDSGKVSEPRGGWVWLCFCWGFSIMHESGWLKFQCMLQWLCQ